jgi:cytochrome c oxidase subunit II
MRRLAGVGIVLIALTALCGPAATTQQTPHHHFAVTAHRYAFDPAHLEVHEGDVVKITLRTADIPHSFVIDALRIAKKVAPGQEVTFELFADRAGDFPFYCNLLLEDGCRRMHGRLVVRPHTEPTPDARRNSARQFPRGSVK